MKKLHLRGMSEDIQYDRCTDQQINYLMQHFESVIRSIGVAKTATFELCDYELAKKYDVQYFSLIVEKIVFSGQEYYQGTYRNGLKRLSILATLEEV